MPNRPTLLPFSDHIWRTHYQWREAGHLPEPNLEASWDRVALAVSAAETHHRDTWRERFRALLGDFRFLPGGRILAGAGTPRRTTLFNAFVAGTVDDSLPGIFSNLSETMLTLQAGGGIGLDFSTLRPAGSAALASGGVASGPASFMTLWDTAHRVLGSGNLRRGRMFATLRCDHPDIEAFIGPQGAAGRLPHFKRSVALTDDFMRAVAEDGPWALVFPLGQHAVPTGAELCTRIWPNNPLPQRCLVHRRLPARALLGQLLDAQLAHGQPGVLFIDRINHANNLGYCEQLATTSAGGAVPLPPHGACVLGSINLPRLVSNPFGDHAKLDFGGLRALTAVATRFLDDVHEVSLFPLKAQEKAAHAGRRIGLGVTGLADMLAMLGLRYGSAHSLTLTREIMTAVRDTAYLTSMELAQEKGTFPLYDATRFAASPTVLDLPRALQDKLAQHGLRNSHLLNVAPTHTISLLANNVSHGVAPVSALTSTRWLPGADGQAVSFEVDNAAWRLYQTLKGPHAVRPDYFVEAATVSLDEQLRMMAAVQSCVDGGLSPDLRLSPGDDVYTLEMALLQAWESGLKGFDPFRP
jgi:ribonucleoside-diphosphate reductase alpha chain